MKLTSLKATLLLIGSLSILQTKASATQSLFKVSGRFVGNTTSGVTLRGGGGELRGTVRPDGTFEIVGVAPGNYIADAVPSNPFGRAEQVRVQSADIRDITIQNPVIRRIAGRIVVRGGTPVPALSLSVPPPPLPNLPAPDPKSPLTGLLGEMQQILYSETEVPLKPGADGTFQVGLPEGERKISVLKERVPAGFAVEACTYGSQNLLNNPIRIAPGPLSDISITIKKSN